ncbi:MULTISPECIES: hypothetical protein [Petrotoga]|uniref:Uncharacterized protein n=2 Tax=Petrotoga sibirica TaxID=156202 RepID=A0A4R8EU59_9BACT|nr:MULTISPECIES: hypothetical protein [Petrotoga]POZ87867.1 hypothetical protein AA80_09130 [Petrotoga sibirica DSM 13575]POZ89938.1 hypothetical protein AD60_09170 [Petrotoga sp. SL27]TDX16134.1 hypothetical protein C8D74_10588 [Petrotoga sibirica]
MKKYIYLLTLFVFIFYTLAFSQSSQMYNYSIYSVLKNDSRSETLLGSVAVIQGYTFNFDSKGNIEATFEITPLNDLGDKVRTKIIIDSVNIHFENTIDLSKNKKNYVTSIYYLEGEEEKTLDIYLQVNNVEKLEFTDQKEISKKNKITLKTYYNQFSYYKDEFITETEVKLNDLIFFGMSNLLDYKNGGYYLGLIFKGLKVGVNYQSDNFYLFLTDKTYIDSFEFEGIFVPYTFSDGSLDFKGDFTFTATKNFPTFKIVDLKDILTNQEQGFYLGEKLAQALNFEDLGFYLGRELQKLSVNMDNNFFVSLGFAYLENQYDFSLIGGFLNQISNFKFETLGAYNFVSNTVSFSFTSSYEF